MSGLSGLQQAFRDRVRERLKKVAIQYPTDQVSNRLEKTVIAFLTEFGVDYSINFLTPPPDAKSFKRQTQFTIPSSREGDNTIELSFKARDRGILVLKDIGLSRDDEIAEEHGTVKWEFNNTNNSINFQENKTSPELGEWKFDNVVLIDDDFMKIKITNDYPFASSYWSMEVEGWMM